jgi:hypothetical protein
MDGARSRGATTSVGNSGIVNAAYDRPPQKITFGEMRDMGVRAHAPPIQG